MTTPPPISLVIFDLDGTLIQTETLVLSVARAVVQSYGKDLTDEAIAASIGRRPLDAWQAVADLLAIPQSAEELFRQSEAVLTDRWHEAGFLPGASRLIAHLKSSGVRLALATSTSRATLGRKVSSKPELQTAFEYVCCGDELGASGRGKPAPDCFIRVAAALGVLPSQCLVIEDAPCGVEAAAAAGMRVVCVPSLHNMPQSYPEPVAGAASGVVEQLPSLLAFRPEVHGLPPFADYVMSTVPVDPVWLIAGTVVKGFGRGSRQLGIPTANLDAASLRGALAEAVTGIYLGWATIGKNEAGEEQGVYPMVMSVGWNPVFQNKEKTCEPWLLHDFGDASFYGEPIRLLCCAFIRPEANFPSLEALAERIHEDARVAKAALQHERYAGLKSHPFFTEA